MNGPDRLNDPNGLNDPTHVRAPSNANEIRPPMVEVRGLHKHFGTTYALRGVDMTVARGEVVVIVGPSGSGKSTVLRCINLLETPTAGTVHVDGVQVNAKKADLNAIRAEVGMVFQQFNLFPHLSAVENVGLALRKVRRRSRREAHSIALAQLESVGIPEKADAYPRELSGGQQQRVAIARALAMSPKVMLFDEPTSALDPEMIKEVLDVMLSLAAEGMTMICVTHEMGFARGAANRMVFMDEGLVVEQGPPRELFEHASEDRTRQFFGQILKH
jgi:polar amino acid transport system ATP-binding protein